MNEIKNFVNLQYKISINSIIKIFFIMKIIFLFKNYYLILENLI